MSDIAFAYVFTHSHAAVLLCCVCILTRVAFMPPVPGYILHRHKRHFARYVCHPDH